jgi:hypothetical protein
MPRPNRAIPALIALLFAATATTSARGSNVTDEVAANSSQATATNPRSSTFTDSLNASFEVSPAIVLRAGASLTLQSATPAASRAQFGESGTPATLFNAGLDWSASEGITFSFNLDGSPRSTQFAGTSITLRDPSGTETSGDALVRSQVSELGGGLDLAWDSNGSSDLEWAIDTGVSYSHYDIDQSIPRVKIGTTTVTSTTLRQDTVAYCNANPGIKNCGKAMLAALRATPVQEDFERLSASGTATVFQDTDLTLGGDYYVYQEDPAQIGYFGLASAGRGPGMPIAPLHYVVRPEVLHRFGDFSARLWVQAGRFMPGTGSSTASIGTKLQYKINRAWKIWLSVSGERDVDQTETVTRSALVALGSGYRW